MKRFVPILALVAVFVLSTCAGCAIGRQSIPPTRTPGEERASTVQISVRCSNFPPDIAAWGSGVVVSKTEVLTAAHVVDCIVRDPKTGLDVSHGKLLAIVASQPDAIGRPMKVVTSFVAADVARIAIADDGEFYDVSPVRLASVDLHDLVCVSTGVPRRDIRCGVVEELFNAPGHDLAISIPSYPGNSGSGLYDARGRLVGIVTQRRNLALEGQISGGRATAIGDRPWVLDAHVLFSRQIVMP